MLLSGVARPSEAPPQGLRGRKRLRTEEALVDAALRLFAGQGYDNTTIEQITAEVEVSPRTFFRYFASKEDVLFVDYHVEPILSEIRAQPLSVSDFDAVRDAWLAALPQLDRRRALLAKRALESGTTLRGRDQQRQSTFRDAVAAALAYRRGLPYADAAATLAATMAHAVLHLAYDHWASNDGRSDLGEEITFYFSLSHSVVQTPTRRTRPPERATSPSEGTGEAYHGQRSERDQLIPWVQGSRRE
jgi:AcrR family transcriptional regulator